MKTMEINANEIEKFWWKRTKILLRKMEMFRVFVIIFLCYRLIDQEKRSERERMTNTPLNLPTQKVWNHLKSPIELDSSNIFFSFVSFSLSNFSK